MKKLTRIKNADFNSFFLRLWVWVLLGVPMLAFAGTEQDDLMAAISASDSDTVVSMLDTPTLHSKIDINARNAAGWNPLSLAAVLGDVVIVGRLLQEEGIHVADGVMWGGQNVSPVILAAMHGKKNVVAEMINSPRFERKEYLTAIKLAMHFGQHSLAEQLLTVRAKKFPIIGGPQKEACARAQEHFPTDQLALAVTGLFEDHCPNCYDSIGTGLDSNGRPGISSTIDGATVSGPIAITQCGHCFCGNCLNTWRASGAERSRDCPICRKPLNSHNSHIFVWNDRGLASWTGPKIPLPRSAAAASGGGAAVPAGTVETQGVLAGYTFVQLPEVTQDDVNTLRAAMTHAGRTTSIQHTIRAFKIADAVTSIGFYHAVMHQYPPEASAAMIAAWRANPELPLTNTTGAEDVAFAAELSRQTGRRFFIPDRPQEEYYKRGRALDVNGNLTGPITATKYYFGDNDSEVADHAWISTNSDRHAHGVREPLPGRSIDDSKNSFGLIHVIGNVWTRGSDGVISGAAFYNDAASAESSLSSGGWAQYRYEVVGSRLAEEL